MTEWIPVLMLKTQCMEVSKAITELDPRMPAPSQVADFVDVIRKVEVMFALVEIPPAESALAKLEWNELAYPPNANWRSQAVRNAKRRATARMASRIFRGKKLPKQRRLLNSNSVGAILDMAKTFTMKRNLGGHATETDLYLVLISKVSHICDVVAFKEQGRGFPRSSLTAMVVALADVIIYTCRLADKREIFAEFQGLLQRG